MKEEDIIESVGKSNPFRVPEGYFDSLSSQIMAKIDAEGIAPQARKQKKAVTVWLRPLLYAAAGVCALFVSVATYRALDNTAESAPVAQTSQYQAADDSFEEAADYAMLDNQDIYACLSSDY